ncbi:MAG: hypothetical protein J6M06_02695 [Synergistaceae bacterium]|nr:hypothetical protein [Synergistaceae bacterium]
MKKKAPKKTGIEKKIERVQRSLDRIELGVYSEFDIYRCCDYIVWLMQFKKAPEEVIQPLYDQAMRILDAGW